MRRLPTHVGDGRRPRFRWSPPRSMLRRSCCQLPLRRLATLTPLTLTPYARTTLSQAGCGSARRLLSTRAGEGGTGATRAGVDSSGRSSKDYSLAAGMLAVALGAIGLSYASVPLYRMFCQATGFGGTVKTHGGGSANKTVSGDYDEVEYNLPKDPAALPNNRALKVRHGLGTARHACCHTCTLRLAPRRGLRCRRCHAPPCAQVTFNTDVNGDLPWSFKPVQKSVSVLAGQTSLAFFEASCRSVACSPPLHRLWRPADIARSSILLAELRVPRVLISPRTRFPRPRSRAHPPSVTLPPGDQPQLGAHHWRRHVQRHPHAGARCPRHTRSPPASACYMRGVDSTAA